jgi:hypothetical protein
MSWKMSIDLSRPLVASMGHHDPLDGYITCLQLEAGAAALDASADPGLAEHAARFAAMIPFDLSTSDPLGLGGLLADAWRVTQLERAGVSVVDGLRDALVDAVTTGLKRYERAAELERPAAERLAFRELGLAIGLAAVPWLVDDGGSGVERLARFRPLGVEIERFWLDPSHRREESWLDHRNINEVMLATGLVPDGYLMIAPTSVRS